MEIYTTDHCGITNETTGESGEGQPFNYYDFRGAEGGCGDIQEVNQRDLYERYIRGR